MPYKAQILTLSDLIYIMGVLGSQTDNRNKNCNHSNIKFLDPILLLLFCFLHFSNTIEWASVILASLNL